MSNQMLEQLRGNLQRESANLLKGTNKDPQMSIEIETHATGNITNNGATYHQAVKDRKGYFFDKNMVIQRGLMKVEQWIDPNTVEELDLEIISKKEKSLKKVAE